jgi:2-phosphosulfolactate phosphatase
VVNWSSQSSSEVRLEWRLPAVGQLANDVECDVVVDVMSFSTCVRIAIDNGALIYPYPWKGSSAIQYADRIGSYSQLR